MLGRDALHLRVRIPQECPLNEFYRVAETPRGSRGISYGSLPQPAVVMDFWVMEEAGVTVVLDAWHEVGASKRAARRGRPGHRGHPFVTP